MNIFSFCVGATDYTGIDSISLGEIQQELNSHMDVHHPTIKIGTPEYYDFVVSQLFDKEDEILYNRPDYNLIHAFLVEYKLAYEDYLLCKYFAEQNDNITAKVLDNANLCIEFDENLGQASFSITETFLGQTIGEIRERNESASNSEIALRSANTGVRSAYSRTAAVAYAHQYALSRNGNYPDYTYSGGDCTNFVSQCLYAGGISMNGTNSGVGTVDTLFNWYCINNGSGILNAFAVTTTWIRASSFNTYMKNIGAHSWDQLSTISALYNKCALGDIVQLTQKSTGSVWHSVIITLVGNHTAYYSGHTTDRYDYGITYLDEANNSFTLFKFN